MGIDKNTKEYKRSRIMYTGEAAFEYLISLLVQGTFLARITTYLGLSDALTGIISSFMQLGCLFQLCSILIRKRRVKKFVLGLSIANQVMFTLLYVIPVTPLPGTVKAAAVIAFLFVAWFLYHLAYPKKIGWLMSLVENDKRGIFTANKEIISLVAGIIFQNLMGIIIDHYKDSGNIRTAFVICAVVLFTLTVVHSLSMFFSVEEEPDDSKPETKNPFKAIFAMLKQKTVLMIALLYVLWNVGNHGALCFFGTYQIKELGFSQTLTTVLASVGSACRIIFSRSMGRYGDKHSFASLIKIGLILAAAAFSFTVFARPETLFELTVFGSTVAISSGIICFVFYQILHGIASASVNSALMNIIFDYVPVEMRSDALAFCGSAGGLSSFLITIALTPLLNYIQGNGNTLFGIPVYTQQLTSLLGVICMVIAIFYVSKVIMKGKKLEQ